MQWGLFASAIYHLGTERNHDEFLADALSIKVPGAFAMTETGHGSDVAAIGTTATYDPATQEFVIHTPFRAAWKDYLGNAGVHGTAATVFARLITQGVDHGVHAFYVPIRDADTMEFLPGVGGEDDGLKGGLNGIDNGRLWFDQRPRPAHQPAQPVRRRRRGRHVLVADREPRPPLLHDARHAGAGPRLARRCRGHRRPRSA